jgi:DNA topoisomerase IB
MPQYFMPAARNTKTRQLLKQQDLKGHRYTKDDSSEVWLLSQALAEDLTARTREPWAAEPFTYTNN